MYESRIKLLIIYLRNKIIYDSYHINFFEPRNNLKNYNKKYTLGYSVFFEPRNKLENYKKKIYLRGYSVFFITEFQSIFITIFFSFYLISIFS